MYDDLFVSTNGDTTFFLLFYFDYVIDSVGFVLNYSFKILILCATREISDSSDGL